MNALSFVALFAVVAVAAARPGLIGAGIATPLAAPIAPIGLGGIGLGGIGGIGGLAAAPLGLGLTTGLSPAIAAPIGTSLIASPGIATIGSGAILTKGGAITNLW